MIQSGESQTIEFKKLFDRGSVETAAAFVEIEKTNYLVKREEIE